MTTQTPTLAPIPAPVTDQVCADCGRALVKEWSDEAHQWLVSECQNPTHHGHVSAERWAELAA